MPNTQAGGRSRIYLGLALVFTAVMMGTTLPTPLYPGYEQVLNIGEPMITVIYGVYALGVIAAAIATGRLSDQIGRRPVLAGGLLLSAASAVCFIIGGQVWLLLVGRVLSGASAGIFTSTATVAVIELAPADRSERATLAATIANMFGLGLGPLFAGCVAEFLPWPLRLCYALHLAIIAVVALILIRAPETADRPSRPRFSIQIPGVPASIRSIFVPAAIAGFAGFAVLGLFAAVAPAFMGQLLHIDNRVAVGAVVFLLFASSTVGQVGQSRLPDVWRLPIGCVGLILGMICIAISLVTASLGWLIAGAILGGLGQGASFRAGMGQVTAASPTDRRAEVASSFFIVVYVAISIPVIGLGLMVAALGFVASGLIFTAAVAVLALISMIWLLLGRRSAAAGAGS